MMNKRGSHVGMILSFVIFITFIVFLYVVVRPAVTTGEEKKTTLDYIENMIEENVSEEFTSISIKINSNKNPNQKCVKLEQFFVYSMVSAYMIVKNETGNVQDAYYDPATDFDDLRINRNNKNNIFLKIYYSPKFPKLLTTTINPCNLVHYLTEYNITSITSDMYVFERSIYNLTEYYKSNYEQLKTQFNIPPGNEFGFSFTNSSGEKIEASINISKSISIYAGETPIQYIDDKANIRSGFINVKVW